MDLYSIDEEYWHECVTYLIDGDISITDGDIVTIYGGDKKKVVASDYVDIDHLLECMSENAWEAVGDCSEKWLDPRHSKPDDYEKLKEYIDRWAKETNNEPDFCEIENIQPTKIKIVSVEKHQFEEIV